MDYASHSSAPEPRPPVTAEPKAIELDHLQRIEQLLERQVCAEEEANLPPQFRALYFDGSKGLTRQLDNHGPIARSIGIINPVAAKVYVGLSGERGTAGQGAPSVPRESAMVFPVGASNIEIGVDAEELGANQATIYLIRFRAVQPFFLGAL
jgi:hypothetical protein